MAKCSASLTLTVVNDGAQGEQGKNVTIADIGVYSNTLSYFTSRQGATVSWTLNSVDGIKVGDTVLIPCCITDLDNTSAYFPCTVSAINGKNISGTAGNLIYGKKGEKGDEGDPAPYTRQIFTAAATKPSTPTETCDQVPSGWSLQIPTRTETQVHWTSMGVVSVKNGTYEYSTWSEPAKYTADESGIVPIVQWKWGSSDTINPDEEDNTISLGDGTILEVNGQAVTLATNSGTDWSNTIPAYSDEKPYLWKREWRYASEGVDAGWVYYCVTGKQGVEGSYNSLGYKIDGSSITFAGLDRDGIPSLGSFRANLGGEVVAFQRTVFTITSDLEGNYHDRYFLVAHWTSTVGSLSLCYLVPVSETDDDGNTSYRMKWVDQDGTEITTTSVDGTTYDPYVLADIRMVSGASIKSVTLVNPSKLKTYESDYFMSIMAQGDMTDINVLAKALDIERVYEKVAAMEAFINKLFANEITITNTLDVNNNISKYGNIHSSGYNKLDYKDDTKQGFYLESTGYAELNKAVLKNASIETNDSDGLPILTTTISNDEMDITLEAETAEYWKRGDIWDESDINYAKNITMSTETSFYRWVFDSYISCRMPSFPTYPTGYGGTSIYYEYDFSVNRDIRKIYIKLEFNRGMNAVNTNDSGIYVDGVLVNSGDTQEGTLLATMNPMTYTIDLNGVISAGAVVKVKINITCAVATLRDIYCDDFNIYYNDTFEKVGTKTQYYYTLIEKKPNSINYFSTYVYGEYIPMKYNLIAGDIDSNNYVKYVLDQSEKRESQFEKLNYNQRYNCENSSITYEGTTYEITSLIKESSDIISINGTTKIDLNSIYPMSFAIHILKGSAVLQTKSIYPSQDNQYTLGTSSDRFKAIYAANFYPPGSFYISTDPTSPASFIGGEWIELKGNMSFWTVAHDTSTTTHLLNSSGEPDTIDAGLPNISGYLNGFMAGYSPTPTDPETNNALYTTNMRSGSAWKTGSGSDEIDICFNAYNCNHIYGNATTVRPPAYKVYAWWRKA